MLSNNDNEVSQEERQKALLQLQWKVMSDNPQDDQEVNSKKVSLFCFLLLNKWDSAHQKLRLKVFFFGFLSPYPSALVFWSP